MLTKKFQCDGCGLIVDMHDTAVRPDGWLTSSGMWTAFPEFVDKLQAVHLCSIECLRGWVRRGGRPPAASPLKPRIVCLCGSTRFYQEFQAANYRETMAGRIVLSVGFYRPSAESEAELARYQHHGENIGCTPEQKIALDALHKRKIDLSGEVLILNCGGYVGSSTQSEILYAADLKKRLRWLESSQCPTCLGNKVLPIGRPCPVCAGDGVVVADQLERSPT